MAGKKNRNEGAVVVRKLPPLKKGRPDRVITSSMRMKLGFMGNTTQGSGGNFYSPELSTDFLELPQSRDEKRHFCRFFWRTNGYVHQAINIVSELPLSKVRIRPARAQNKHLAKKATRFCEQWADDIGLLHRLLEILHDFNLIGECFIFAEDSSPDMPHNITHEVKREVTGEGLLEYVEEREDADERALKWLKDHYRGWTALRVLPPEQVHMRAFPFTDKKIIELIPDSETKSIITLAMQGDEEARGIVESMPDKVIESVYFGKNVPLNTDPDAGSFVYHMARKKSQYEPRGISMVEPLLRSLVYRDKLRQAQTSIASRHMTPYRIVWAENLNVEQIDELREQVDLALQDPDFSVITNFQVNWEERGADQRLLNLDSEYEITNRELYAGTGMTEGLLTGESVYSGDRLNLEVINRRFMLVREILQRYVDGNLFKPMCRRMGFLEVDEDGREQVIYPRLSFTRLTVRDNQDTFDILFNLYQKGSLDVYTIYEHLNLDAEEVIERIIADQWTPKDATYNEFIRSIYSRAGDAMVESSNILDIIAEKNGIEYSKEEEGGGRFASLLTNMAKKEAQRIVDQRVKTGSAPPAPAPASGGGTVTFTNSQLQELIQGIVAGVKSQG